MQSMLFYNSDLNKKLEEVREKIENEIRIGDRYLNGSLDYVKATTGKMLRPMLLLAGASFGKKKLSKRVIDLAAAVETLHIATLVHDDIIDEAKLRRGQQSIQAKYSKEYAVYMGDFLLSRCFLMLSQLDIERELAVKIAKAVNQICLGEMKQNKWRYDMEITPLDYLKIISGKTAALFSLSLSSGAYHTKAKFETVKLLAKIGFKIGMAFQLIDDVLDYEGDANLVGKEVKSDIIRGYYSLPLIFALRTEKKEKIKSILNDNEIDDIKINHLIKAIIESSGIHKTKELAKRYTDDALRLIKKLPDCDGKEVLEEMIPKLLYRVF